MRSGLQTMLCGLIISLLATAVYAQEPLSSEVNWRRFAFSLAAHGSGTAFDSWTSWQHVERSRFLAVNGRFTSVSAGKKAGAFAAATLVEVLIIKKWGKSHPWIERTFSAGNFTAGGIYMGAGVRNLGVAGLW